MKVVMKLLTHSRDTTVCLNFTQHWATQQVRFLQDLCIVELRGFYAFDVSIFGVSVRCGNKVCCVCI